MTRRALRVYILGTGRLGLGLALALRSANVPVVGLWNRSAARRRRARRPWGGAIDGPDFGEAIARANLVLVCVSDDALASVAQALRQSGHLARNTVVAHCSGALAASELGRLPHVLRGSLHPLVACATARVAARELPGAAYAVEGDAGAVAQLHDVVRALRGRAIPVSAKGKARYHAAAVMSSSLVLALVSMATQEAQAAGMHHAERELLRLTRGAIEAAQTLGCVSALTGPLVRGDVATLTRHMQALGPRARAAYTLLSTAAFTPLLAGKLTPAQRAQIVRLLEKKTDG
ncbi:MAG: DUF2520 domain-containing protein [Myxococcota bacterium]